MAQSPDPSPADDGFGAVVRRLGSIERQLDQVAQRLGQLEAAVEGMRESLDTQVPRMQREVVTTGAMVDAVAAQVAADMDAMTGRLDRMADAAPRGGWRRWFGGGDG